MHEDCRDDKHATALVSNVPRRSGMPRLLSTCIRTSFHLHALNRQPLHRVEQPSECVKPAMNTQKTEGPSISSKSICTRQVILRNLASVFCPFPKIDRPSPTRIWKATHYVAHTAPKRRGQKQIPFQLISFRSLKSYNLSFSEADLLHSRSKSKYNVLVQLTFSVTCALLPKMQDSLANFPIPFF